MEPNKAGWAYIAHGWHASLPADPVVWIAHDRKTKASLLFHGCAGGTHPGSARASKHAPNAAGELVAVKVQRPHVLGTVSLDLYLMRNVALQ